MLTRIREQYTHRHTHSVELTMVDTGSDFDSTLNDFLSQIHSGTLKDGQIHRGMYDQYASTFTEALTNQFGSDFSYSAPDNRIATYIRSNLFQFSAAKTDAARRAFADQLIDSNGAIKSFSQFKKDVSSLSDDFNENWLNTEYNQVVASSQAATKWMDVERDKAALPYLRFRTMEDDRVRPEHAQFDNMSAPVDDPVWDIAYPPLDWGCRCHVLQEDHYDGAKNFADNPLQSDAVKQVVPREFRNNIGKTGTIFTKWDATIAATDSNNIGKFDASSFQLPQPSEIAATVLPEIISADDSLAFGKAWLAKQKDAGVNQSDFIARNMSTGDRVIFGKQLHDVLSSGKYDVTPELLNIVRNADEVWVSNKTFDQKTNSYVFIKYFKDKPAVVIAKMNEENNYLEAVDAYTLKNFDDKKLTKLRKGILLYSKKY